MATYTLCGCHLSCRACGARNLSGSASDATSAEGNVSKRCDGLAHDQWSELKVVSEDAHSRGDSHAYNDNGSKDPSVRGGTKMRDTAGRKFSDCKYLSRAEVAGGVELVGR